MWEFMVDLNKQGTTIILTTHYLEEAEQLCRNIAIINKGEIVQSTSVRALLSQLTTETFVFDLNETVSPDIQLSGFPVTVTSDDSLEVTVEKGQSINDIFALLSEQGVQVRSMRTKSNRLEELFVHLVQEGKV